jgi:hypothetical protein
MTSVAHAREQKMGVKVEKRAPSGSPDDDDADDCPVMPADKITSDGHPTPRRGPPWFVQLATPRVSDMLVTFEQKFRKPVELRGFEPLTFCMPCSSEQSGTV